MNGNELADAMEKSTGGEKMISVGMDISKGKSTVCLRRHTGEVLREPFEIFHSEEDLDALCTLLEGCAAQEEVRVVMEATGIYHLPALMHLQQEGFFVAVINPLMMKKFAAQHIRRGKNDKRDALKIAAYGIEKWYQLENFTPEKRLYEELRMYGRQYSHYVGLKIKAKQNLSCLLERVMPGIVSLLPFDHTGMARKDKLLDFVEEYRHFEHIAAMDESEFLENYKAWAHRNGYHAGSKKAAEIYRLAAGSVTTLEASRKSTEMLLSHSLHTLREMMKLCTEILLEMQELAGMLPEYSTVRSMNGVGDVLAVRLIAEIGDVRRFHSPGALVAYAGIDSPEFQSGTFSATKRHISKRGSALLRKIGYEVMQSLKRIRCESDPVYCYMQKKEQEGKNKKVCKVAGMNKFFRIYYARVMQVYRQGQSMETLAVAG